ncbi:hypothetical protein PoB_002038600 [Plakobranchus ocellatus]|uniref:Uncharacterized protein n=1 Tax=Plakobranchus ocellatus TaxID=259542 RepID=A0AAV3ZGV6_9GAST|nr:hypothetical protein PoB_002038600 [Plakobranchus ocellatus]
MNVSLIPISSQYTEVAFKLKSSEYPYDLHTLPHAMSTSNAVGIAEVSEQDEKEFLETLSTVLDEDPFSEEEQHVNNGAITSRSSKSSVIPGVETSTPASNSTKLIKKKSTSHISATSPSAAASGATTLASPRTNKSAIKSNGKTPSITHVTTRTFNGTVNGGDGHANSGHTIKTISNNNISSKRTSSSISHVHRSSKYPQGVPTSTAAAGTATGGLSTVGVKAVSSRIRSQERRKRLSKSPH